MNSARLGLISVIASLLGSVSFLHMAHSSRSNSDEGFAVDAHWRSRHQNGQWREFSAVPNKRLVVNDAGIHASLRRR